jgi:acetyl-CoA acetyltransferase
VTDALRDQTAIVGVGITPQGKVPGCTNLSLQIDAFKRALDDAGLRKEQIDGLLTEPALTEMGWSLDYLRLGQALGINPAFTASVMQGGATAGCLVQMAALAVNAGMANYVACVFGDAARTGVARGGRSTERAIGGDDDSWGIWGAFGPVTWSAVSASRHMALYGTTTAQLAEVAVAARRHAALHPLAVMREPITVADHQASRWIVEPLRLLDCCLISDGGVCLIVTTAERARDLRQPVVTIAGMGQSFTTQNLEREDWWYGPHQKEAVDRAYAMAGLGPGDVQVAELYDNFTISVIMWLEHAGFCGLGEGGPFVEGGRIQLGGVLPVNTHGGHLSAAHPEGWWTIAEGVEQVRGTAGARQVPGAEVCLATGRGMLLNCASALLLRRG